MRLIFGTHNQNKLAEIRQMVGQKWEILGLSDINWDQEIEETGTTLEENAQLKVDAVYSETGLPCFAEDSGLEVEALDGAPGVYTARFAGPQKNATDNMQKLLELLKTHPRRNAQFRAVIAYRDATGLHVFQGRVQGMIANEMRGNLGFGYDPIFIPKGYHQTFGENPALKKVHSHRLEAFSQLRLFLDQRNAQLNPEI